MKTKRFLLLIATVLSATAAGFAQSIAWTGDGDGSSWSDQNNWVGLQVPGTANQAIITNSTSSTVVIDSDVTVQSILCTKALTLTNGSLTVTAGNSLLQGALAVPAGSTLAASGSGTTLTATGPTTISGADFTVTGGAVLSLPGAVNYQPPTVCNEFIWQASGTGSVLSLTALTNVTGNTLCSELSIQALSGGQVLIAQAAADAMEALRALPGQGGGQWHALAAGFLLKSGHDRPGRAVRDLGLSAFPEHEALRALAAALEREAGAPLKFNMGCGRDKRPGYVNVDQSPACGPDQVENCMQQRGLAGTGLANKQRNAIALAHRVKQLRDRFAMRRAVIDAFRSGVQ